MLFVHYKETTGHQTDRGHRGHRGLIVLAFELKVMKITLHIAANFMEMGRFLLKSPHLRAHIWSTTLKPLFGYCDSSGFYTSPNK